jgi:protein TonB
VRRCCLATGFAISSLVHLTLLAAVLASRPDALPASAGQGRPLELDLAMFANSPIQDPEPKKAGQVTETKPEVAQPEVSPPPQGEPPTPATHAEPTPVVKAEPARQETPKRPPKSKSKSKSKSKRVIVHQVPRHRRVRRVERRLEQVEPFETGKVPKAMAGARGGGPGGPSVASLEATYLAELRQAIARRRSYPSIARRLGLTGRATVSFVLEADGRITNVRLASASGHAVLDEAAVATVHRLGQFKPIPAATGRSHWSLRVPLDFSLN